MSDVTLKDPTLLGGPVTCASCGAKYEGFAVELADGRFAQARVHAYDELDEADAYLRDPQGRLTPLPEWQDAPIFPFDASGNAEK